MCGFERGNKKKAKGCDCAGTKLVSSDLNDVNGDEMKLEDFMRICEAFYNEKKLIFRIGIFLKL